MNGKQTVFLVEDEFLIRLMLTEMLEKSGYSVREFPTVKEALSAIHEAVNNKTPPAAVITDNNVEAVDAGMKILRAAKEAGIPRIMMSATALPPQVLAAGGSQTKLVRKPFQYKPLIDALESALEMGCKR
jgi:DNA-binding NtrC family response regulator